MGKKIISQDKMKKQNGFLLAVFCLLSVIFLIKDVWGQNPSLSPKKDSKADSLRPKVEFDPIPSQKSPFYNYVKAQTQKFIDGQSVKEEKQSEYISSFVIQGAVWGEETPLAIIDNKVLRIGDIINDAVIEKIDKNGITVSVNGRPIHLDLPSSKQKITLNNEAKSQEGGKDAK